MEIVIVGAGEVGRVVAERLADDGHEVRLVERSENTAKIVSEELDVDVITGNGARPQVLAKAGIVPGGNVDMLIACTDRDEVNMLSCWIAHNAGVKQVVSRTRSLEFTDSPDWGKRLGIDAMISPERSIAREILGLIEVSAATHAAELMDRRAALYTVTIAENSPLAGMMLKDIRRKFPKLTAVFVYVEHDDGVAGVPDGFTQIRAGDNCYIVTYKKSAWLLAQLCQPESEKVRKIFIVGGGKIGVQIASSIRADMGNVSIRIFDKDYDTCRQLSALFGETLVINSDGADEAVWHNEGIDTCDAYICATQSDETNLVYCALAKKAGAGKTIAISRRKQYHGLSGVIAVDAVADPSECLAGVILKFVRFRHHALAYTMIENINAEMLELVISGDSPASGKSLMELKLGKGIVVALVGRGNDVLIPGGNDVLLAGDRVIIFALSDFISKSAEMFGASQHEG